MTAGAVIVDRDVLGYILGAVACGVTVQCTEPVDPFVTRYAGKPCLEGTTGFVGVPTGVEGEKRVLRGILDHRNRQTASIIAAQPAVDFGQKPGIGRRRSQAVRQPSDRPRDRRPRRMRQTGHGRRLGTVASI